MANDGYTISTLKALYRHCWRAPRKNKFGGQDCPATQDGISLPLVNWSGLQVERQKKSVHPAINQPIYYNLYK